MRWVWGFIIFKHPRIALNKVQYHWSDRRADRIDLANFKVPGYMGEGSGDLPRPEKDIWY